MADQVKLAAENSVSIVGRLADVDVRTGVDKGNKEYVSIKGKMSTGAALSTRMLIDVK